jgi:23S rRNA pseudouridine2605 synthase
VKVRLQKYLAEAGLGSRRACEEIVRSGRVLVDGAVATLGSSVDAERQTVSVDGHVIAKEAPEYWLLNKPAGVLSAAVDRRGRRTVVDCVPARSRVFPVGRLDLASTGLVLLTNDGELAARLLHPRYHVDKEYLVVVHGVVGSSSLERLRSGIELEEGVTAPADVRVLTVDRSVGRSTTTLRVIIHEGRKRQVRRMLESVGHRVMSLHRSRFAGLSDGGLALGESRRLTAQEIRMLKRAAGLL